MPVIVLRFLNYVNQCLASKVRWVIASEMEAVNLEEKLIHYVKTHFNDGKICGVEHLAQQLGCSRRQVQRILKKLVEEKRMNRLGKGKYQLEM